MEKPAFRNRRTGPERKRVLPLIPFLLLLNVSAFAQPDTTFFFKSALSITQNGFSFIPSFSLGKPAIVFEPSVGNRRLSFEPQFRFALEGKPWSFVFMYKYKIITGKKFTLQVGGHIPSIVFQTRTVTTNGVTENAIISQRFLAAELTPTYTFSENLNVGMYLLRGHGYDPGIQNSYYAGLRSTVTAFPLKRKMVIKNYPQVYYLKLDDNDGVYVTNTISVGFRNFPFSVSGIVNQALRTTIAGKEFDWNVSLVYTIDKNFVRQ